MAPVFDSAGIAKIQNMNVVAHLANLLHSSLALFQARRVPWKVDIDLRPQPLKVETFARRVGIDLSVVSQFCFESGLVLSWAARMKGHGLPLRIGLAGPASLSRLLRFAVLCGIGNSVRALKARPQAIARLLVESGPEVVVREIARHAGAPIAGIHFFCFGGLVRTARWLRAIRDGRFELTSDGGFRVGVA